VRKKPVFEAKIFFLNETQQEHLSKLLVEVCPVKSDYIVAMACRFRAEMDWDEISATIDLGPASGSIYHLDLSFPMHNTELHKKEEGYIKIYVWRDAEDNYSINLSSSENPDFAMHRYSEGVVWERLRAFYEEMDEAIPD
jgi:hypothetical protein